MKRRHYLQIFGCGLGLFGLTLEGFAEEMSPFQGFKNFSGGAVEILGELQVYLIVSPYCSTSNAFSRDFAALEKEFPEVRFYYVMSDAETKEEDAGQWSALYEVKGEVLDDREQKIAKKFEINITPTALVLHQGKKIYQGRINDWYTSPTRKKRKVEVENLREVLRKPQASQEGDHEAVGCKLSLKNG